MENKELVLLLKKHTEAQEKANSLYSEVISELYERGILNETNILSCLNNTEPLAWAEIIIELICK